MGSTTGDKGTNMMMRHEVQPINFSTQVENKETKNLIWEVRNFKKLTEMDKDGKEYKSRTSIYFTAGKEIGLSICEWHAFIKMNNDDLGFFLKLVTPNKSQEILADFLFQIKRADGTIFCTREVMSPENYAENLFGRGYPKVCSIAELVDPTKSILCKDVLTIQFKLDVYSNSKLVINGDENVGSMKLRQDCRIQVGNALMLMVDVKCFSDVTLRTRDGTEFNGHKVVLSGQSEVFRAMFSTQMSESEIGIVKIDDIDGSAFKTLLKFMYTGQLDENWYKGEDFEQIINSADKYGLPFLKELCDQTFPCIPANMDALDALKFAKLYNLHDATRRIKNFIKSNPDILDDVLNSI